MEVEPYLQTSYSQQKTLLRCPKKFDYQYIQHIVPQQTDNRFLLGRAVHKFLEVYYGAQAQGESPTSAFPQALDTFKQYVQDNFPTDDQTHEQSLLAEGMVKHYYDWARTQDDFKVLGTEIPFELKVAGSKWTGVFDGIVEYADSRWILEHKTAKQISTDHTMRDKQISAYVLAAQKLDIPVNGVIYNSLKKAVPEQPKVLKSGKLSQSLSANITYDSYMQAIHEHGFKEKDYGDILNKLRPLENPFFHREFVPRSVDTSTQVLHDIQNTEVLKYSMIKSGIFPRNDTKDCNWDCPFSDLCLTELEGRDTSHLFQEKYKVKHLDK